MSLSSIEIENYRIIKQMKIDDLRPINVLVGRNNSGKSAFLECIALFCSSEIGWKDALGNDILLDIIQKRGGHQFSQMLIRIGEEASYITGGTKEKPIKLMISKHFGPLTDKQNSYASEKINDYFDNLQPYLTREMRERVYEERIYEDREDYEALLERINFRIDEYKQKLYDNVALFIAREGEGLDDFNFVCLLSDVFFDSIRTLSRRDYVPIKKIITGHENDSNIIYMIAPTMDYLETMQKKLALSGELEEIVRKLRKEIPYFENIREVDKDFYIYMKNDTYAHPLNSLGDGFKAKLSILSAISAIDSGVIIIEEPEQRLHPGFMEAICESIVDSVDKKDVQYYLSTHSLEFIEYLLENNPEKCNVIQMFRDEKLKKISYAVIKGEDAKLQIEELERDLRGY